MMVSIYIKSCSFQYYQANIRLKDDSRHDILEKANQGDSKMVNGFQDSGMTDEWMKPQVFEEE